MMRDVEAATVLEIEREERTIRSSSGSMSLTAVKPGDLTAQIAREARVTTPAISKAFRKTDRFSS
jgi:hypothetical protein